MPIRIALFFWACGILSGSGLLASCWKRRTDPELPVPRRYRAAWISTAVAIAASSVAFACLCRMLFGGGHPTAQMTGSYELWSWWFHTWGRLMLSELASGLAVLVSFFYWWRPEDDPRLFWARLFSLGSAIFGLHLLAPLFPDA